MKLAPFMLATDDRSIDPPLTVIDPPLRSANALKSTSTPSETKSVPLASVKLVNAKSAPERSTLLSIKRVICPMAKVPVPSSSKLTCCNEASTGISIVPPLDTESSDRPGLPNCAVVSLWSRKLASEDRSTRLPVPSDEIRIARLRRSPVLGSIRSVTLLRSTTPPLSAMITT